MTSAGCICGEMMTVVVLDEEDEARVSCSSCDRLWLLKRSEFGWLKKLVQKTPTDRFEEA